MQFRSISAPSAANIPHKPCLNPRRYDLMLFPSGAGAQELQTFMKKTYHGSLKVLRLCVSSALLSHPLHKPPPSLRTTTTRKNLGRVLQVAPRWRLGSGPGKR